MDNAIHIKTESYNCFDGLQLAKALHAVIKGIDYQLILAGRQSIDSGSGQVPFMLAELLNIPQVMYVTNLEAGGGKFKAIRDIEGGKATVEGALPAMITCQKGLNEPRYPSLKGIMASKKKKIDEKNLADLAAGDASVSVLKSEFPPPRPPGRILQAETAEDYAKQLVKAIREEIKAI